MSFLGDDEFGLASLDSLGDSDELREQARLLKPLPGQDVTPPARQVGADATESVRVSVDARGRFDDVEIDARWRDQLGSEGFAGALLEAYTVAVQQALTSAAVAETVAGNAGGDRAPEDAGGWPPVAFNRLDEDEWLAATQRELDEVLGEVERLDQVASEAAARGAQEQTVTSTRGCLTLQVRGGGIVGATGDVERIRHADPGLLREEAASVFYAARQFGSA